LPLSHLALRFGAPEYFSLIVLGLVASSTLAHGPILKSLSMIVVGIMLSMVGTDLYTGSHRLTFGYMALADGISFVVISVGLFGIGEIIRNLETTSHESLTTARIKGLFPTLRDFRLMAPSILRGTGIGSFLGLLPGAG